jgi:deoxyadenosine/deoxycytidine kinase
MLNTRNKGKIIAFSGLSGIGKSTMARILSKKIGIGYISEPEESEWPALIVQRALYGPATALLAFRQIWAKMYVDANVLAQETSILIDTYFFKIFGYYLNKPGMEWLLPPTDPYLPLLLQINHLDQTFFPDAQCVVLFDIDSEDWLLFLKARGRNWDKLPGFVESHELTKKYIREATITHCKKNSIKLIHFQQKFGNPDLQAEKLKNILAVENII